MSVRCASVFLVALFAVACGGSSAATEPAEPTEPPETAEPSPTRLDDGDDGEQGDGELPGEPLRASYLLYVLPHPATGGHAPPMPAAWENSRALFDEAVEIYQRDKFAEAAAAFLRAAEMIRDGIDPYHADSFAKIRELMCGNAGWSFLSIDDRAAIEAAAAARDESDPACAAGLRGTAD